MIAWLVMAAFAAGVVDAIAGGGGLITVPALLMAGLDPRVALATNKGQAIFGSSASFLRFARHGQIDRSRAPASLLSAGAGAFVGARLVLLLDPSVLRPVALALLLIACATSLLRRPGGGERWTIARRTPLGCALGLGLVFGAYDGFFGPGTGTFLLLAYAHVFGDPLVAASGNAKVTNFASNLAAFLLFAASGSVRWQIALPMGVAQMTGAYLGTELAVRRGAGVVRGVAVAVSAALAARIAWQMTGLSR